MSEQTNPAASVAPDPALAPVDALVSLRGVTCGYGDRVILENIDIQVRAARSWP